MRRLLFLLLVLGCVFARLRRRIGEPHGNAIGQPQIDRHDVARQEFFLAIEPHQPLERLLDIGFRQADVDAVIEPQVPAAFGDENRSAQHPADIGKAVDDGEEIVARALCAFADQKRQAAIAILDERFEDRTVGGNDADGAVLLPERKSLPLGHADLQTVGIKLEHGGVGDPGIGHEPGARRLRIKEQKRGVAGHAGDRQHLFAADFLRAGQRNGGNTETGGVGRLVAGVLQPIDDVGDMAAGDGAVAEGCGQEKNEARKAKSARRQPCDPHAAAFDPLPVSREPRDAIQPIAQRLEIKPTAQPIFSPTLTTRQSVGRRAAPFRP